MNLDDGNKIVNFNRLYHVIKSSYPNRNERILTIDEIKSLVEKEIENRPDLIKNVEEFIKDIREYFNTFTHNLKNTEDNIYNNNIENAASIQTFRDGIASFTETQIKQFFKLLWSRYRKALISPGEAVGAVAAQSIG